MKDKKIKILALVAIVVVVAGIGAWYVSQERLENPQKTRTITDMYDRQVKVPLNVKRIACMPGPSYETVFMLGGKDQIVEVRKDHRDAYPLANLTNPDLKNYSTDLTLTSGPKSVINIEEFINADLDVVIYYYIPKTVKQFENAGIPCFVLWSKASPHTMDEEIAEQEKLIRRVANLLGGKTSAAKAEEWCRYYEEKVQFIRSRTENISDANRTRVYIGNSWGTNPLTTWGSGSGHDFVVELCGGVDVGADIKGGKFPEVSLEQVLAWHPDVIIIDNHGGKPNEMIKAISNDPDWASIPAVKNHRIYRIPSGVFFLDKASSKPVYYLWLAKQLHPDMFKDVDMVKEMQEYFKKFYDYNLSVEDAEHALQGWGK
ncbi:MAG: Cobalamin-binding protein precursor [Candidatus Methanolliviera sp. GoM_oil]|nr:MAG: Cobalamin-binding protein precursor [Candidatus Methanolliviera sp. GoM_oil]